MATDFVVPLTKSYVNCVTGEYFEVRKLIMESTGELGVPSVERNRPFDVTVGLTQVCGKPRRAEHYFKIVFRFQICVLPSLVRAST